jgi:hypothetical protein
MIHSAKQTLDLTFSLPTLSQTPRENGAPHTGRRVAKPEMGKGGPPSLKPCPDTNPSYCELERASSPSRGESRAVTEIGILILMSGTTLPANR